jgi:succinate dehydrogenase / fumarate reductase iron-sulfur subunit
MNADDTLEESPSRFEVRILRQDRPGEASYWQSFLMDREEGLNVTSVLQQIVAKPRTITGHPVTPVAYEANCLEEVCGSCTMVINGHVRQACSALVDQLLAERPECIELRPLSKFPVVRDLIVDRRRLFRALEKLQCWLPVDGYYDLGPGPKQSQESQSEAYPLSECMSCGCCLEACPQYVALELPQLAGETPEAYRARADAAFDRHFIGAHANSQVVLMNSHPTGNITSEPRLAALLQEGGVQNCGKAANCQAVCPKKIPLMTSWARSGRAATLYALQKIFAG